MSGYNGAAWLQYHQGRRTGVIPPPSNDVPRRICSCCGLLMTLEWHEAVWGDSLPRYVYRDPSDDPHFLREQRSAS